MVHEWYVYFVFMYFIRVKRNNLILKNNITCDSENNFIRYTYVKPFFVCCSRGICPYFFLKFPFHFLLFHYHSVTRYTRICLIIYNTLLYPKLTSYTVVTSSGPVICFIPCTTHCKL